MLTNRHKKLLWKAAIHHTIIIPLPFKYIISINGYYFQNSIPNSDFSTILP